MELLVQPTDLTTLAADALVVNLFENDSTLRGATEAVDLATGGLISEHLQSEEFTGKLLDTLVLHSPRNLQAKHVILIGLGPTEKFSLAIARQVAAKSIQKARELKAKTVATIVHGVATENMDAATASEALVEGLLLGHYQFNRYKTQQKAELDKQQVRTVFIAETNQELIPAIEQGVAKGEAIATAILNARDIINEPPSKIKPSHLAKAAEEIAGLSRHIKATILEENQLRKEGYGALLAVAAGSEEKPYLIHLHYRPVKTKTSVAFIGKGVTFDSGGLGIKPWNAMLHMKMDMAGAANVLGIFQALAELEAIGQPVNVEVHGVIAATENMISGKAMRPDDIIISKSGKTIEVLHTDAEGRLILADALTYTLAAAQPTYMIDFATLTGAAVRALGIDYSAVMSNNRHLLNMLQQASQETGELIWELPLHDGYKKHLESSVADLQNITTNDDSPGAIFGGLFLQEFVEGKPWAHLDIAGPAFRSDNERPLYPKGASGYGILLGLKALDYLAQ